ncbi:intradiol ring-cleavage dioxygenase [Kribbella sandramycini]|uniref:Hydroxyquinol 1,2-dioxygenase n=2 Tax=Kribbella sandramycini TaxID=60450 RepID=A0A7Y4KZD6_9ACTN|nr:intradiol ring-cleavage dioxygenase [Kribbella sandramycini]MBB6565190.1 hydroxyquinol 1,2-dioxygenase [Kribbella sandramycini]NOL41459.1 intradiol ring-cleavage dioxygenase [Kribbella sandramycini]
MDLHGDELTDAVVTSFDGSLEPRTKEVMSALVRHLHAFAREVDLTEDEYFLAIDFLTRTGQISDDKRQEFVLLADTLGLSMLTVGLGSPDAEGATESTVFGPFFVEGSPEVPNGADLANGAPGQPCLVSGRVLTTKGEPIAGATVETWQADEDGFYDVQKDGLTGPQNRGHLKTDADGNYSFWAVKPVAYPIPVDGPVGEMLRAGGRGWMRPAHIHFMVTAPGYHRLITHVFEAADPYLQEDAVFGVKDSLVTEFTEHPDGHYSVSYDLVLAEETP